MRAKQLYFLDHINILICIMELGYVCCVGAILITNWKNVEFENTPAPEKEVVA
jgi:hypothetical protein